MSTLCKSTPEAAPRMRIQPSTKSADVISLALPPGAPSPTRPNHCHNAHERGLFADAAPVQWNPHCSGTRECSFGPAARQRIRLCRAALHFTAVLAGGGLGGQDRATAGVTTPSLRKVAAPSENKIPVGSARRASSSIGDNAQRVSGAQVCERAGVTSGPLESAPRPKSEP